MILSFEEAILRAAYRLNDQGKLPPRAHKRLRAGYEVTIDKDGEFIAAVALTDDDEPYCLCQVTPESLARSGRAFRPHGLAEQAQYLSAKIDAARYTSYMAQIASWDESKYTHPAVSAVRKYLKEDTFFADMETRAEITPDAKTIVRWRIKGLREENTWLDEDLMRAWIDYYDNVYCADKPKGLCYLTGEMLPIATSTEKDLISGHANAKLISSNDTQGFTYRGNNFTSADDAFLMGDKTSFLFHAAVRYLCKESPNKIVLGKDMSNTLALFDLDDPSAPLPIIETDDYMFSAPKEKEGEGEEKEVRARTLKSILMSGKTIDNTGAIVYAIVGGVNPGRIAVKNFGVLTRSELYDNVNGFNDDLAWERGFGEKRQFRTVGINRLIRYALGTVTDKGVDISDKLLTPWIRRLLSCKLQGDRIPKELINGLMRKYMRLYAYKGNAVFDIPWITYAALHKYYKDWYGENYKMELEKRVNDRSYQYGRLLAMYDKIERDYLDEDRKRPTQASRLTSTFVDRPLTVSAELQKKCQTVWFRKLARRGWYGTITYYEKALAEIYDAINRIEAGDPAMERKRLEDSWVFGYYGQNKLNYTKRSNDNKEENE